MLRHPHSLIHTTRIPTIITFLLHVRFLWKWIFHKSFLHKLNRYHKTINAKLSVVNYVRQYSDFEYFRMQKKGGYSNYSIPGHPTLSLFVFVHSVGLKEKKLVQRTTYNAEKRYYFF